MSRFIRRTPLPKENRAVKIAVITTVDTSLRFLLLDQMRDLAQSGFEVVAISAAGPNVSALEASGILHVEVPLSRRLTPIRDIVALWKLWRVIRREQPVIVHTHTPKANLLGQIAAVLARTPIRVSTIHGFYFTPSSPLLKRLFFHCVERISCALPHTIFVVNAEDMESMIRMPASNSAKLRLLGSGLGVDLSRFDRLRIGDNTVDQRRREFGLDAKSLVVGFVGRLVAEKGLLELMGAAGIVRSRMPDVRFLIIGPIDSDKPDALTPEIARDYGVEGICTFTCLRIDTPELYAMMDVLVLPSHREGCPLTLMEASAMGVPCVATDIRGCRGVVEEGRNGLLVPMGNVDALADAIVDLLLNPEKARRFGEEGRRMARERFDRNVVFSSVSAEYGRLLQAKGLPVPGSSSGDALIEVPSA